MLPAYFVKILLVSQDTYSRASGSVFPQPPLGSSDHLVISIDIDFMVRSTNEHPYYCNVYSFNNAGWDGFRDYRDVPWLDIFGHNVNQAGKKISDWIQIGIDCFIPHRKYQMKPDSLPWFTPSAIAHIVIFIFTSFIGRKLGRMRSSLVLLGNIVKGFLKRPNPTMLMQLAAALLPLSILDHENFGEYLAVFLTEVSLQFPLFLMGQRC